MKTSLDQLRQGLTTLNVLETIKTHLEQMKKLFVHFAEVYSEDIITKLHFSNGTEGEKESVIQLIREMSIEKLKQLLSLTTGAPSTWC